MQSTQEPAQDEDDANVAMPFNIALRQLLGGAYGNDQHKVDDLFFAILVLCPFAFYAYADADPDHGWSEYMEDGCIVQHLSRKCLQKQVKKVLKIELKNAQNLPVNMRGRSDHYIVFSTGLSRERSEDKWNDSNPSWGSTHHLLIKRHYQVDEDTSKLHVELYYSDDRNGKAEEQARLQKLRRKKYLGSASIPMCEVLNDEETNYTPCLKLKKGRPLGQDTIVTFNTKGIDFNDVWKEAGNDTDPTDGTERPMPKSKKDLDWDLLDKKHIGDFKPIGFINAVKRGTQVWVYADQNTKTIAITFRGTERTRREDIRTVFQFYHSKLDWESTGNCKLSTTLDQTDKGMRLHAGFVKAYDAVRIALLEMVYGITEWSEEWTICFTGHSLGGALAVLCSFDYAHLTDQEGKRPEVFTMSFGAPRVGNKAFKDAYEEKVKHGYRVACGKDIICSLPLHFHHVGQELRFGRRGRVRLNKKLVANVEVDVQCIENELKQHVIRKLQSYLRHKHSISRQTTASDPWIRAVSLAQDASSRGTLSHSSSFGRPLVDSFRTRTINHSISRRSLLSAPSVQLRRIQYNQGTSSSRVMPSITDHSENRYHHFATAVARRVILSIRCMRWNCYRSADNSGL